MAQGHTIFRSVSVKYWFSVWTVYLNGYIYGAETIQAWFLHHTWASGATLLLPCTTKSGVFWIRLNYSCTHIIIAKNVFTYPAEGKGVHAGLVLSDTRIFMCKNQSLRRSNSISVAKINLDWINNGGEAAHLEEWLHGWKSIPPSSHPSIFSGRNHLYLCSGGQNRRPWPQVENMHWRTTLPQTVFEGYFFIIKAVIVPKYYIWNQFSVVFSPLHLV